MLSNIVYEYMDSCNQPSEVCNNIFFVACGNLTVVAAHYGPANCTLFCSMLDQLRTYFTHRSQQVRSVVGKVDQSHCCFVKI